jgi:hypothetical protein
MPVKADWKSALRTRNREICGLGANADLKFSGLRPLHSPAAPRIDPLRNRRTRCFVAAKLRLPNILKETIFCPMAVAMENIASEALLLPEGQRLALAHRILASVESGPEAGADAAWDEEIQDRIRRYDAGLAAGHSGPVVFAQLDEKLQR